MHPRFSEEAPGRLIHALALTCLLSSTFIVLFGGVQVALGAPENVFEAPFGTFLLFYLAALVLRVGLVVGVGLRWFGRIRLHEVGWRTEGLRQNLLLGLAGGFAATLLVSLVVWIQADFQGEALLETFRGFSWEQRAMFLLIGLEAAFTEETLFRGYLQPALMRRLGTFGGLTCTAILFSLYHLQPRPLALGLKFVLGLLFGSLRGRNRSLWTSFTAHVLLWTLVGSM